MRPSAPRVIHEPREDRSDDEDYTEESPLLYYFPGQNHQSNMVTTFVVGCLMFVLLSGFSIGVYLLILQSHSDNLLPPPGKTLHLVQRSYWDGDYTPKSPLASANVPTFKADCVVVHQTDSRICEYNDDCIELIRQLKQEAIKEPMPFSFLISNDGSVYEYLGLEPTAYIPFHASLVLGFIGNYTHVPPTKEQIRAAKTIIDMSVNTNHLDPYYTIIGKNKQELKYLVDNPESLINEVDSLMFVILTRMYKNMTEAMEHM